MSLLFGMKEQDGMQVDYRANVSFICKSIPEKFQINPQKTEIFSLKNYAWFESFGRKKITQRLGN